MRMPKLELTLGTTLPDGQRLTFEKYVRTASLRLGTEDLLNIVAGKWWQVLDKLIRPGKNLELLQGADLILKTANDITVQVQDQI
jgi:hypothetical protein